MTSRYKIAFIGNGGCGKTTFLTKYRTKVNHTCYEPTYGVEVHPILFTPNGEEKYICFNCLDCSGQEAFGGLHEKYYIKSNAIVICFDVNSKLSIESIPLWMEKAAAYYPSVNIVLMGMKNDLPAIKNMKHIIESYNKEYCIVSTKNDENLDAVFQLVYNNISNN